MISAAASQTIAAAGSRRAMIPVYELTSCNFTAAIGVPTLDGMGAVGGGAHAVTEHVFVSQMAERAALVAGIARAIVNA